MSEFDKTANAILRRLNENYINSADDAIQHRWAKTIAHPGLGEEDEEFLVVDHSLTADGVVEEYYVDYNDELISVPAGEATIVALEEHGEETEMPKHKKKEDEEKKKKKDHDEDHDDEEDEEELNSIREAYGLPKKRKGPHGARPKLNCRSVHSL